jgi:iron-sulfur cluster assembly protein
LTSAAEARIAELMGRAPEDAIGVKLSTPRRGCSGLAYSVDYVTDENPLDEKIETPGGTFYVDGGDRCSTWSARSDHGLARGRFRRRLRVRQSQRQGINACGCGEKLHRLLM